IEGKIWVEIENPFVFKFFWEEVKHMQWKRNEYLPEDIDRSLELVERTEEGEASFRELRPVLGDVYTYTMLTNNGIFEPEIEDGGDTLGIDYQGPEMVKDELVSQKIVDEDIPTVSRIVRYATSPFKAAVWELPYQIGYRTEGLINEDGASGGNALDGVSRLLRYPSYATLGGLTVNEIVKDSTSFQGLVSEESIPMITAAVGAGVYGGMFLQGRANSKLEKHVERYLDTLDEEIGDADIEITQKQDIPALTAEELEEYEW
ncbi:MAG: hypothetical protein ABEJ72_09670, partial [Candidatus Aenigmatarchaeota archaeon]